MEFHNKFGSMSEFGSEYPRGFFVCAFVACPTDKVQQFAGTSTVVDLGVKYLGDLEFRFIVDHDWRWRRLDSIRNGVRKGWLQH